MEIALLAAAYVAVHLAFSRLRLRSRPRNTWREDVKENPVHLVKCKKG